MHKIYFILLFNIFSGLCVAQNPSVVKLNAELEKLKKDPDLEHASWGFCVLSAKTGEVISQYNNGQSLVPASTFKIVTTAASLGLLGADYRYKTRLEYDGVLDTSNGVLSGNLYIKGSGDPSLGSDLFKTKTDTTPVLQKWADMLKQKGIRKIEGAVIADASAFEDEMMNPNWVWSDIANYYGAGACGLSYLENKYAIYFKSGKNQGDTTTLKRMEPVIPGLTFKNYVKSTGTDDNAYIYGAPYSYERYVIGTIPPGRNDYEVSGSIPDPAWFCAYSFASILRKNGITVEQEASSVRQMKLQGKNVVAQRRLLYIHVSPSLEEIVKWTNLKSNNLFAESLLKTIALKKYGRGADTSGISEVKDYWKNKGLDLRGFHMDDGCGLSRMNTITTLQQARMLQQISKEKYFNSFYNSLPVAGRSGSLGSLFEGTSAENNLRAKSGYLTRARGYAGYVKNKKGELLCFSLLANNYECIPVDMKHKMEQLMILIAELQ